MHSIVLYFIIFLSKSNQFFFFFKSNYLAFAFAAAIESKIQKSLLSDGVEFLSPKSISFESELPTYENELRQFTSSSSNSNLSPEENFTNLTILGHVLLLSGKYDEATQLSNSASSFLNGSAENYIHRYSHVISIKHRAIIGTAYEGLNLFDKALELYESAALMINDSISASSEALFWAEQLYYRFSMLATSYKWDDSRISFAALRGYERISRILATSSSTKPFFSAASGLQRRLNILNVHFVYSSAVLQHNPTHGSTKTEVQNLSDLFEKMLFESSEVSKSTDSNGPIEKFIETIMQNWRKTMTFSPHFDQVYTPQDLEETKRILILLRRATIKTFHSCAIMRHLVFVLSALGQYEEALMAFDTYTDYQEKARIQQSKASENTNVTGTNTNTVTSASITRQGEAVDTLVLIGDDDKSVVRVFTKAIDVLVKVKRDGLKAKETADKLRGWLHNEEKCADFSKPEESTHIRNQSIGSVISTETASGLAIVWASIARAYTLFGFQAFTSAERDHSFILAVNSFETCLSYSPADGQVFADYGLLLARILKVPKALEVVRRGLIVDPNCYASWHLLSLLLAAVGEYDKALEAITNIVKTIGEKVNSLTIAERGSYLQIKISQIAIVEAINGIDKALELIPEVFFLFGELFPETYNNSAVDSSAPPKPSNSNINADGNTASNLTSASKNVVKQRPVSLISNSNVAENDNHALKPITSRLSIRRFTPGGHFRRHIRNTSDYSKNTSTHIPDNTSASEAAAPSAHLTSSSTNVPSKNLLPKPSVGQSPRSNGSLQKSQLAELWVWAASLYRKAELYRDAEEALIEAENVNGPTIKSHIELGLLIRKKRPLNAFEEFETALEMDSNNLAGILALAQLILEHCDLNKKFKQRQEEKQRRIEEEVKREMRMDQTQTQTFKNPFGENSENGIAGPPVLEPTTTNDSSYRPYQSDDEDEEDDEDDEDYGISGTSPIPNGKLIQEKRFGSSRASEKNNNEILGNKPQKLDILFLSDKDEQAAVARVNGLLETAVHSGYGFNSSEAWFLLSQYLERNGDSQGSIAALWKSVGLEESRSVRDYTVSRWIR